MDGSEESNGRPKKVNGRVKQIRMDGSRMTRKPIKREPMLLTLPLTPRRGAARREGVKDPEFILQEVLAGHPEREPIVERFFKPILQRLHPDIPSPCRFF